MAAVEPADTRRVARPEPAYFDDFTLGMTFRSPSRVVCDDDVRAYTRFSNDVRPIFDRKADEPLPVPQMYLFSLGVALLLHGDAGYIPEHFVAFYGFDSITFHGTAIGGTMIRSSATVTDLVARKSTGLVAYRHETSTVTGQLLTSSEQRILVRRRTADV
ncbi:hypothetical protein Rhow_005230 [Rhodococcus wratislaviensis]|uniref:Acyl dehydratase n=1 Tax=Rhodococcus wratislaviensis TaxID=44752 RepID=A0A402CD94_RHOWR|nr:MaoC family dehydratase [Rhodococcus wratislaviensis]GCE41571.1 hypothetical protein Rhow_005230 [Rhodococcus wratislaviensis]